MRKPTPACPLVDSELYSRWPFCRVVELLYFRQNYSRTITSHLGDIFDKCANGCNAD